MEKIEQASSWNESPTPEQIRAIVRLCCALKIKEPLEDGPTTRLEARNLLYQLKAYLREKNRSRK